MTGTGWTIDELAQHAAEVLASEGVRAPNGRVSVVPDRRAIRWYATIGLLDRPLRTSGRIARYGERHLLQLVAVKRRQAEGHSLAAIQAELAGATDTTLRQIAGQLPATPTPGAPVEDGGERRQFWRVDGSGPGQPFHVPVRIIDAHDRLLDPGHPVTPVYPVPLHPAATLTLPAQPTADDLAAIHAAAKPLLDLLADRGLLPDRRTT